MIREYHRPETIEQALKLLARPTPHTLPLGGGTLLNAPSPDQFDVVDLQLLNLDRISKRGNTLVVGATATLQTLLENTHIHPSLQQAIRHEASRNLRQVATAAGSLVAANGRSPFATACLALDAALILQPDDEKINYGDLLPLRNEQLYGRLITQISIPLQAKLAYQYVARSPADLPIVAVALAQWPSGRCRLVLGGYGDFPLLALDGKDAGGLVPAAENTFSHAGDEWASAEYRLEIANTLVQRSLKEITSTR